jgi:hypothetical protein
MATDAEVAELREWIDKLFGQVRQLRIDQYIWEEVQKIIASNSDLHKPSHFYAWMRDMYVSGVAMAIRRQLDDDTRTMSFYRFLKRIKGDPSTVSRRRYASLYTDGEPSGYVTASYDNVVGEGKAQPSSDDVQGEIDELKRVACRFVDFANQVVAHDDQNRPESLPTFAEVDTVISYLEGLSQRYLQLLKATHRSVELNFQYDWKTIFRVAWLPPQQVRGD